MPLSSLLRKFAERNEYIAVQTQHCEYNYFQLAEKIAEYRLVVRKIYEDNPTRACQSIAIQSDFSFESIAAFFAIMAEGHVAVLISPNAKDITTKLEDSVCGWHWQPELSGEPVPTDVEAAATHHLLAELAQQMQPGFVVFSSGSSAMPKAVLHSFLNFTEHLQAVAKRKNTLAFLLLDHIAGVDTLFYTLFAGGTLSIPASRSTNDVLTTIEKYSVEVLPASPSFLKLLNLSGNKERKNLDSLEIITYGSEPMPEATLTAIKTLLPKVRFIQKYGTSEFGSPRTQTKDNAELWMRLDSQHLQTKVVDDVLWVRTKSMMKGYLNAEQPVRKDGWMSTGDRVEVDGNWYRILGRNSEMINVGGEKVFPSEVEAVIEELDEVETAVVSAQSHAILGQIVVAKVNLSEPMDKPKQKIRKYCLSRLENYKVPMKVTVVAESLRSERHKKVRTT